jgi:S1-C subfamily serine protease
MHADYHRPTDTAEKVNYDGIAETVDLAARVVTELAQMPREQLAFTESKPGTRPSVAGSTTNPTDLTHSIDPSLRPGGASLGAIPDYTSGQDVAEGGLKISGTSPGSPAAQAGLKAGDVLTHFDGVKIESLEHYTELLGKATPGKAIKLQYVRDGKTVTIEITPARRPGRE